MKKFELGATLRPMLVEALRRALEGGGIGFIEEGDEVGGRRVAFGVYVIGAPAGSGRGPLGRVEG